MPGWQTQSGHVRELVNPRSGWTKAKQQFLAAVAPQQRQAVATALENRHAASPGLRQWLRGLIIEEMRLPKRIPPQVIAIYLEDADALPLYGCSHCALALPVKCISTWAADAVEEVYFDNCPSCGQSVDLYGHWSA